MGMEATDRIAQWENMTQADPDNSMGWLSLGTAYKDADRTEDAAESLRRAIEIDQALSRAYQLLGQVLTQLGRDDEAADVLMRGYAVAAEHGDVMPQKAMGSLLEKLGRPVPQIAAEQQPAGAVDGENTIIDRRTGRPGPRMAGPPMRGALGQFVYDHFTQPTWTEWIGMGTKVINELRLDFSNVEHQDMYDQQMMEWLGISQEEVDAHAATTPQNESA
jgi:Fe-S cluster biosynthesis and repair protein YggX